LPPASAPNAPRALASSWTSPLTEQRPAARWKLLATPQHLNNSLR